MWRTVVFFTEVAVAVAVVIWFLDRPGEVFIFMSKDSRDEAALWSSRGKEQRMHYQFSAGRIEIELPTSEELKVSEKTTKSERESVQTKFQTD